MFAFLTRGKAAGIAAGAEAAASDLSAGAARRKRVFDRTVMSPDIAVPAPGVRAARDTFGLKPPGGPPDGPENAEGKGK